MFSQLCKIILFIIIDYHKLLYLFRSFSSLMFLFEYEIEKGKKNGLSFFFLDETSKCITLLLRLGNRKSVTKGKKSILMIR